MDCASPLDLAICDAADATRVLLLEREPNVARSLAIILGSAGFAVDIVDQADLEAAVATAHGHDLVLLGPNPPMLESGDLATSLRVGRIDRAFRILSASVAPGGDPDSLRIIPFP
jgi:DNA-binding response OmpR family regulator